MRTVFTNKSTEDLKSKYKHGSDYYVRYIKKMWENYSLQRNRNSLKSSKFKGFALRKLKLTAGVFKALLYHAEFKKIKSNLHTQKEITSQAD